MLKRPTIFRNFDKFSENSEDYEEIEWIPMSRNSRARKPINPSAHRTLKKSSRVQDWVNFNIKSLGDGHDSDSGFEQSTTSKNEYHSQYIEPWTHCHKPDEKKLHTSNSDSDKVRIFVAGPQKEEISKKNSGYSYKSTGPNDERFYVSDQFPNPAIVRKKKKIAPLPPTNAKRSIGLQTEESRVNEDKSMKKTYLFATSSNEMAFPNSMPPKINTSKSTSVAMEPGIPDPDYSPIILRKVHKPQQPQQQARKKHRKSANLELWSNAARYRGSLEELDQESTSPDESQVGNSAKVRELADKLKRQAAKDKWKQQQREFSSLKPRRNDDSGMSSRRSTSEERQLVGYASDSLSMLSMSTSNIPMSNYSNRMSQYSPRSWNLTSSRSNGSLSMTSHDHEHVSMMPYSHEQTLLNDVKTKQSHFFNSLFPSRANRFGFPVYPQRTFGIPSQMNAPVSFAGFSPEPSGPQSMGLYGGEEEEPKSILSELPKMLLGRKKKYNFKGSSKKSSGIFGLF